MVCAKVLSLVLVLVLVATVGAEPSAAQDLPLRITLVMNGVLGNKSLFDSAQRGMDRLVEEGYNVEVRAFVFGIEPARWQSGLSTAMADTDSYDLLIVGTSEMGEFLGTRAHLYPDKYFIVYAAAVAFGDPSKCVEGCKNVYSVIYAQNEGSFLAGVYAGAMTRSDLDGINAEPILGAVGGQNTPEINDYIVGYEQGACLVNPTSQVIVRYAGGWSDPAKGKELALAEYEQEADVVFQIAGQTGIGVFQAAQEQGKYAIGMDSDQATFIMDTDPEQAKHILTSMVRHVDYSLFRAVVLHLNGELPYGTLEELGVAGGGVGLAKNDIYDEVTPGHVKDLVNAAEGALVNGEIPMNSAFGEYPAPVGLSCDQMPATDFDVSKYLD